MNFTISISTFFALFILCSCDAVNHLHYSVRNTTNKKVRVHIPSYPTQQDKGAFSQTVDTIIEIQPNESFWIGTSPMKIGFPWETRTIYKNNPGICGLEQIEQDSVATLDCSKSSWKYKKGGSVLEIK